MGEKSCPDDHRQSVFAVNFLEIQPDKEFDTGKSRVLHDGIKG